MSEIDSCVRIHGNYDWFRKFIAAFSTICVGTIFRANFAFGHPPEICPLEKDEIFTTVFFLVQFLIHRCNPFENRSKIGGDFAISKQVPNAKIDRFLIDAWNLTLFGSSARVLGVLGRGLALKPLNQYRVHGGNLCPFQGMCRIKFPIELCKIQPFHSIYRGSSGRAMC